MLTETLLNPWDRLAGKIAQEVLEAPKTCGDFRNLGEWPDVEEQIVTYLENNVLDKPWANHFALTAVVMAARRLQSNSIQNTLWSLSARFPAIFKAMGYESMQEWDTTEVFKTYLRGELLPDHTDYMRSDFWSKYSSASNVVQKWLNSLPVNEKDLYRQFILPIPNRGELYDTNKLTAQVLQQAKKKRKINTEAILPSLSTIRAISQLRLNRLTRVRQAFNDALKILQNGNKALPFSYFYDEGEDTEQGIPPKERLHFRIWDRRSFALAHQDNYSEASLKDVRKGRKAYSDENNHYYLEFVRAEHLISEGAPEGLWFEDLLKRQLLGALARTGTKEEVKLKQQYLYAWGYGNENNTDKKIAPFHSGVAGLLNWSVSDGLFIKNAQSVAEGVFIPIESLYASALFGLLALDIFTTTGMRINECMQIRMAPDCLKRVTQPAPPEAADQTLRERVCLMLIPKGERRDEPHPYYIGTELLRLMQKTLHMLREHYNLHTQENLPEVSFDPKHARAFRFKKKQPYLFQYSGIHLSDLTIRACLKFLLHGMSFKTIEGKNVVVTAHLLRHAFATHAVQILKIPVDVVREWLQQKDVTVTEYYSQVTDSMIAEHHDQFLLRFAANINLGKQVLRAPEEQVRLYNDARNKIGTLAEVEGGHCVSHGFCAAKFACIGCAGKVVDPAKRYQVERKKEWAKTQIDYCREDGLIPEINRLEQLIRDCDAEMAEMDMIDHYRRDGNRVAFIRLDTIEHSS